MESIGKILMLNTGKVTEHFSSANSIEKHKCSICGKEIEPYPLQVLARTFYLQRKCKCEIEQYELEMQRLEERDKQRKIENLYSIADLGERFMECTLEKFEVRLGTENAYATVKAWIDEYPNQGSEGIILYGPPGNGKSHLASAIIHKVIAQKKIAIFTDVPELFARIKATYSKKSKETESSIVWACIEADVLVLDDIGAEYTKQRKGEETPWAEELLFKIINGRYRRKVPTIYTTNLSLEELFNRVGERIYDRVFGESIHALVEAPSYRKEQAKVRNKRKIVQLDQYRM